MSNFASLPTTGTPTTAYQVALIPGVLSRIQGYYTGTADGFLLLFDRSTTPIESDVPTLAYALSYNAPFSWGFDPGRLTLANGLYVAVSSTEATYTPVTASASVFCSFEGEYGPATFRPATETETVTTGTNADLSGPARIYKVTFTNNDASARCLMVFDNPSPTDGDIPLWQSPSIAAGGTATFDFGTSGLWCGTYCLLVSSAPSTPATATAPNYYDGWVSTDVTSASFTVYSTAS